jgi:hypothetical protein
MQTYTVHDARPRTRGINDKCVNCAGHGVYKFGRHVYEVKIYGQYLQTYLMSFCDDCDQKIIARSASGHDSDCSESLRINICDDDCVCECRNLYVIRNVWETCTESQCKYCITGIY